MPTLKSFKVNKFNPYFEKIDLSFSFETTKSVNHNVEKLLLFTEEIRSYS